MAQEAVRRPANSAQSDLHAQHAQRRVSLGEALLGVKLLGVAEPEHVCRALADGVHRDAGLGGLKRKSRGLWRER